MCYVERPENRQAMRETGEEVLYVETGGETGLRVGAGKEAGYGEAGKEEG
jgi:hypothetical protein